MRSDVKRFIDVMCGEVIDEQTEWYKRGMGRNKERARDYRISSAEA